MAKTPRKPRRSRSSDAAPRRQCGAMQVYFTQLETDPGFRSRQVRLEQAFRARLRSAPVRRARPYRIQTVVHVVYNQAAQNISDAQILSQIEVLNQDFRATNPDRNQTPDVWKGLVADSRIEFALARKGPDGKPSSGITRTRTDLADFGTGDRMKSSATGGVDPWPTDRFLNIWVCLLRGGLLGYAQFPGGPAATDGVVITHTAFGTRGTATAPFNRGRTATHEVGHFLNLRHIWGDTEDCSGSDLVADTPNSETANYGTPAFPHISCQNGPHGDMFMNYMDYVDDAAMFMFTQGQVERMITALESERSGLIS